MAQLYVFSGLPGVGKTTIARLLALDTRAVYLRVDTIESALVQAGIPRDEINAKGYTVSSAVALDNLKLGNSVIADMVNPIGITRTAWQQVAESARADLLNIQVVCTDPVEHRRRVEERRTENFGHEYSRLEYPSWDDVSSRDYEEWLEPVLRIDTSVVTPAEALILIKTEIGRTNARGGPNP